MKHRRLVTLLVHQCTLSLTEAIGCLENRLGEAVSRYGGRETCLRDAIKARSRLYKQFNNSPFEYWFTRKVWLPSERKRNPREVYAGLWGSSELDRLYSRYNKVLSTQPTNQQGE